MSRLALPRLPSSLAIGTLAFASIAACSSADPPTNTGGAAASSTSAAVSTSSASGGGGAMGSSVSASIGGGGEGGSMECVPGEASPCYTGPAGTLGVGACKAGSAICNPTGFGFGPCTGQVTPKAEVCGTPEDDDCNGSVNDGCVCAPFSQEPCYSGPAGTLGVGVCVSGYHVCQYSGLGYGGCVAEVVPGVENCASAEDEDCDGSSPPCSGAPLGARAFGGALDERGVSLATDALGNVVFAGVATGAVDLGCGALPAGAAPGGVIAKLAPGGACLWSKRLGDGVIATAAATDPIGNVHLTGTMTGTVDFGAGPLVSAGGTDVFFLKLDPNGALLSARRFGGALDEAATGLAVDDSNSPIGIGTFQGEIDFGGGPLASQGGADIYLVKLGAGGDVVWAKAFGDASDQEGGKVAVDTSYGVLVTAGFTGVIDVGGGPLVSAGERDVLVAKLDSTGEHLWSLSLGDAADQAPTAIGADRALNVVVAGGFDGALGALTSAGGRDGFLISFDLFGAYRWGLGVGDAGAQSVAALAVDPFGNVALGVDLQSSADFGGGPLTSAGGHDIAVAKYDPAGIFLWGERFGAAGAEAPASMVFSPSGSLFVTGVIDGPVDFGGGLVGGAGGEDACLFELAP